MIKYTLYEILYDKHNYTKLLNAETYIMYTIIWQNIQYIKTVLW
jgi:hypothetical protein